MMVRSSVFVTHEQIVFLERYRGWILMRDSWRTANQAKRDSLRRVCETLFAETTRRQERLEELRSKEPRPPEGYVPESLDYGR